MRPNKETRQTMIVALDIGGTKLAAALVQGREVLEHRQTPAGSDRRPEAIVDALWGLAEPWVARAKAVAVACAGTVRSGRVTAPNQDTYPWIEADIQGMFRQKFGQSWVLNDADAAAWGEARFGAGRGMSNFMFVTISTGVGSGLILNGGLIEGSEIGFTKTDGVFLELLSSGKMLDAWAVARGWGGAAEVVAKSQTDPEAAAALDQSARRVAEKLYDAHALLNLECVAVGGGLGLAEGYIARVQGFLGDHLRVEPAQLGAEAPLVGVADWVETRLELELNGSI
ncbi:MAG: ROK family protein [Meiothermus sp.]|nr:ROK family protein [Meiothermus sp.]